ncbi:MAG: ABC transporter permease subunit, partial [Thermomicrobiales bacterium]
QVDVKPIRRIEVETVKGDWKTSFQRRSRRALGRDWPVAYLFIAPTAILLIGLIGYPLVEAVRLSFYNVTGITNRGYVGLLQYERLWNDRQFRDAISNTVQFAVVSVFFKFWFGLLAASILNRARLRFSSVFTGLVLLPWIIPEVVAAFTWRGLYDPIFGGLNILLIKLGFIDTGISFLGDYDLALPSVIAVNVWKGIPFFTIIFLAGLKAIDKEQYDAASVDGANGWNRFRDITLPGLRYVIIVAALLSFIWTLNSFGIIYLMTGGGPGGATRLFSILSYEYAISSLRYSAGVAVAMSIVPALLVLIIILGKVMQSDTDQPKAKTGPLAAIGEVLGWPFAKLAQLGVIIVGAIAWPFVVVSEKIGQVSHDAYVRGNNERERPYRKLMERLGDTFSYLILGILLLFLLFPFYWVIVTAFKTQEQIRTLASPFAPAPWTLENFRYMLQDTAFPRWFWNTIQVAVVSTTISVVVASLGAYALVRLRWRGSGMMSTVILFTYLMPTVMLFIPLYRIFTELHLINSLGSLMLAYPTFGLPFACWLLMGYYRSIPKDLEEAALTDGANHLQCFVRIVLPLTLPALLAVALFSITSAWNEFLLAFVLVSPEDSRTLPVGLSQMIVGDIFPYGQLFAASIMTAIPVAVMYMVAQRFMVAGLTAGSVKG